MPNNLMIFALGGPDGVGKSTAAKTIFPLIQEWIGPACFRNAWLHWKRTPSMSSLAGIECLNILANKDRLTTYPPLALAQLFVLDMMELAKTYEPRYDDHPVVLLVDRWTESTWVYQGAKINRDRDDSLWDNNDENHWRLQGLQTIIKQAPRPITSFILNAPDAVLDARIAAARKNSPNDSDKYLQSDVRIYYRQAFEFTPWGSPAPKSIQGKTEAHDFLGHWVQIDSNRPADVIAADIAERIKAECRRLRPDVYGC